MELFTFERTRGRDKKPEKDDGNWFSDLFKRNKLDDKEVKAEPKGERVILKGRVKDRETAEKIIVAAGNNEGVSEVESRLEIERDDKPKSRMYTVKSGDTLSKIAREFYGEASKYPQIFEANRPMLEDPDKIYPGQVLRIPPER
jgi:nucleoid-associated protein YgaU